MLYEVITIKTQSAGPDGALPLTSDMLMNLPSGDIFGMTMNAGMGWQPEKLLGTEVLLLSTLGGMRQPDGKPTALALHQGRITSYNVCYTKLLRRRTRHSPCLIVFLMDAGYQGGEAND